MIRVFDANEKEFTTNGNIVLLPYKCTVSNADNGEFILEAELPSKYSDYIEGGNIIVAPTPRGDQGFRIRTVEKNKKKLKVKAYHLFYDGDGLYVNYITSYKQNAMDAMLVANDHTDAPSPFHVVSNIQRAQSYTLERTSLTECFKKIAELWEGHLIRDNWDVMILNSLERDNGITIRYGKNLEDMTATYDWSNICTKLLPIGKNDVTLRRIWLYAYRQYAIPYTKAVSFNQDHISEDDFKDWEGNTDTERYTEALRADLVVQGEKYLQENSVPAVNYTLKGRPERVTDIGDVIEVIDERIGVRITTQVISYKYDCIRERYEELEFGNFKKSLKQLIKDIK